METPAPMRPGRRRAARTAVLAAVACIVLAVTARLRPAVAALLAPRDAERAALEILRGEDLRFLVTDRVVAQVVVESSEADLLLGRREGCLIARVALHFGVDLGRLSGESIGRDGAAITVTVPEPEELDFAVDLGSMRYMTRRSGLQVAADWIRDRDQRAELRAKFREAARASLRAQGLLPARADIVARLNRCASVVSDRIGTEVRFR